MPVVVVFELDGWDHAEFAVEASVVEPVDVLDGRELDAFIVRMVFVPATLALLGNAAWWVLRWLDRILPPLDTEGLSLDSEDDWAAHGRAETAHSRPSR